MHAESAAPILVFGATGRVGQAVVRELLERGVRPRCAARDPARIAALFGERVTAVAADMNDAASLQSALRDGDRVFVMSPVVPAMAELQCAVIAAAAGKAARIVKLSGSRWTQTGMHATFSGLAHRRVEDALQDSGIAATIVRPGVFSDGFLRGGLQAAALGELLPLPMAEASAAFVDVGDIAALCAQCLASEQADTGIVELSCAQPVSGAQLAAMVSDLRGVPIAYRPVTVQAAVQRRLAQGPATPFELMHLQQMLEGIQAGAASAVSNDFERLMGRSAVMMRDIVARTLAQAGAAAGSATPSADSP